MWKFMILDLCTNGNPKSKIQNYKLFIKRKLVNV